MRRIRLTVIACLLMLVPAGLAQATDEFINPSSPTISVGYYALLEDGNDLTFGIIAGIFDTGVDKFQLYEVVCCVPQLADQDLDPDFDCIDQWSWDDFTYSGWYIGGVYQVRAYDSSNNILDQFEITVYDDFP